MRAPVEKPDAARLIREGGTQMGFNLDDSAVESLVRHIEIVRQWRDRISLTSLDVEEIMAVRHVLDSLTVFKVLPKGAGLRLLDIGTGAGFPGVALRIVDESILLTLLDRDPKKIVFLKVLTRKLGLSDIAFLNRSLADFLRDRSREVFDVVISRAFSSDTSVLAAAYELLAGDGSLIRMCGPASLEADIALPLFRVVDTWEGTLPFSERYRRVIRYVREP